MAEVNGTYYDEGFCDVNRNVDDAHQDIVKETVKANWNVSDAVKDARSDLKASTEAGYDRLSNQATAYFIASQQETTTAARDIASLKVLTDAMAARVSTEIALNVEKGSAATALAAEKIASAVALGQSQLSKEIFADGQKTRDLINDLKYHDLNRALVERQTELVNCENDRAHGWRQYGQVQAAAQFAQLQSQVQAFQSQLQETRQGMVNFGTMAGVGQTSTSNNVR